MFVRLKTLANGLQGNFKLQIHLMQQSTSGCINHRDRLASFPESRKHEPMHSKLPHKLQETKRSLFLPGAITEADVHMEPAEFDVVIEEW